MSGVEAIALRGREVGPAAPRGAAKPPSVTVATVFHTGLCRLRASFVSIAPQVVMVMGVVSVMDGLRKAVSDGTSFLATIAR